MAWMSITRRVSWASSVGNEFSRIVWSGTGVLTFHSYSWVRGCGIIGLDFSMVCNNDSGWTSLCLNNARMDVCLEGPKYEVD